MSTTRIRRVHLRDFQQFRDVTLDFTDPKTGKAANRICFIGRNGTGKSTILQRLAEFLTQMKAAHPATVVELEDADERLVFWHPRFEFCAKFDSDATLRLSALPHSLHPGRRRDEAERPITKLGGVLLPAAAARARFQSADGQDLLAVSNAEALNNHVMALTDVPATNLSNALGLMGKVPYVHQISNAHVSEMWTFLVYLVKRRESDRQEFENRKENLSKTKQELIELFDEANPAVLDGLAHLWNRILSPAGLEFDIEGARLPVQLNENLHAYIRTRGSKKQIPYNALSTGIRNFLFRIGHLYLLYFGRQIRRGFVLIDEPENSLFPDFLFELTSILGDIVGDSTQLFVATHSPIVAAQFEPHERIVLDFDDDYFVTATKGTSPKGDDPNDLLLRDFGLPDVMGPTGREAWQKYLQLRKQIRRASDADKPALVKTALALGERYGFDSDQSAE